MPGIKNKCNHLMITYKNLPSKNDRAVSYHQHAYAYLRSVKWRKTVWMRPELCLCEGDRGDDIAYEVNGGVVIIYT